MHSLDYYDSKLLISLPEMNALRYFISRVCIYSLDYSKITITDHA